MEYLIGSIILSVGLMGYAIWWDIYRKQNIHGLVFDEKKYQRLRRSVNRQHSKMTETGKKYGEVRFDLNTDVRIVTVPALSPLNVYEQFASAVATDRGMSIFEDSFAAKPVLILCKENEDGETTDIKTFTGDNPWKEATDYFLASAS